MVSLPTLVISSRYLLQTAEDAISQRHQRPSAASAIRTYGHQRAHVLEPLIALNSAELAEGFICVPSRTRSA